MSSIDNIEPGKNDDLGKFCFLLKKQVIKRKLNK